MSDADDYKTEFRQLLPPGDAFAGEGVGDLLAGLSQEPARFDQRMQDLLNEADLRTTFEMLADWEGVYGLPDECVSGSPSVEQRRIALVAKENDEGGQSIADFTALAGSLGYVISIDEFRPLRSGFRAGARCAGTDWAFAWRVNVLSGSTDTQQAALSSLVRFRAGSARAGDRLTTFGASDLQCVIRRAAPAHTTVIFAFPGT